MRTTIRGLIAGGLFFAAGHALAVPADDIKTLLEQNKFGEAYQLGKAQPEQFGDPAFDFFFGIAALDAGHAGEGVLALERYLLNFPDNRSARYQLARGYFILGEDQRARDEFEALTAQADGAEKQAIDRFLDALRARESRYNPSATAYLEVGLGFDNNINAGPTGGTVDTIFGIGALDGNSQSAKEGDSFTHVAGGVQGIYPVGPGIALTGSVGFDARLHHETSQNDVFDQFNFGLSGGASFLKGNNIYKVGVGLGQLAVDNQRYVFSTSLFADWSHQYDQFNRFDMSGQVARLHFDNMSTYALKDKSDPFLSRDTSNRTADYYGLNAGWTHVFGGELRPVLKVSANYGEERNQHDRPDYSRDIYGVRAMLSVVPAPRWGTQLGLGYQEARYQARHPSVPAAPRRDDQLWSLDANVSYQLDKQVSLRAEYTHTDQSSNIKINEYNRDLLVFKVRYDFK